MQAEDNAAKGELRVSAEDYKAALAMDPDHTAYNVHLYLGICKTLVRLGRGKEAISSCTEALKIDGELVDATQVTMPAWNCTKYPSCLRYFLATLIWFLKKVDLILFRIEITSRN